MKKDNINLLIKQSAKGNTKAQLHLYNRYCNAMYTICLRYIKNTEDAKDVMQEGFIKAFNNLYSYNQSVAFGAWLKRILINTAIDFIRQKQIATITFDQTHFSITNENEDWLVDAGTTRKQIIEAINNLPEPYRIVTQLYLLEGYDHTEISEILNIPVKTSRTQLHRAKLKLKQELKTLHNEKRY